MFGGGLSVVMGCLERSFEASGFGVIRLATTFLPEMGDLFVVKQIIIRRAGQLVDLQSSVRLMESSLDGRLVSAVPVPVGTNAHRSIAGRGFGQAIGRIEFAVCR